MPVASYHPANAKLRFVAKALAVSERVRMTKALAGAGLAFRAQLRGVGGVLEMLAAGAKEVCGKPP